MAQSAKKRGGKKYRSTASSKKMSARAANNYKILKELSL